MILSEMGYRVRDRVIEMETLAVSMDLCPGTGGDSCSDR